MSAEDLSEGVATVACRQPRPWQGELGCLWHRIVLTHLAPPNLHRCGGGRAPRWSFLRLFPPCLVSPIWQSFVPISRKNVECKLDWSVLIVFPREAQVRFVLALVSERSKRSCQQNLLHDLHGSMKCAYNIQPITRTTWLRRLCRCSSQFAWFTTSRPRFRWVGVSV